MRDKHALFDQPSRPLASPLYVSHATNNHRTELQITIVFVIKHLEHKSSTLRLLVTTKFEMLATLEGEL